jgi:hypothetical protein
MCFALNVTSDRHGVAVEQVEAYRFALVTPIWEAPMGSKDLTIAIRDYAALEQQYVYIKPMIGSPLTRRLSGHSDIRQLLRYIERPFSIKGSPLSETRWAR